MRRVIGNCAALRVLLFLHFIQPNSVIDPNQNTNITFDVSETPVMRPKYINKLLSIWRKKEETNDIVQDSTRYGLQTDSCPNGDQPQLGYSGQIKWCKSDRDCKLLHECVVIIGMVHFGEKVHYCCPSTRASICMDDPYLYNVDNTMDLQLMSGCAVATTDRPYYFDRHYKRCMLRRKCTLEEQLALMGESFLRSNNRFRSLNECRAKCESSACKLGESILLQDNEDYDNPVLCDSIKDCPVGYTCRQDKLFRRRICCGYTNFEPCPRGSIADIVPYTGRVRQCTVNVIRDDCPNPYLCTQNAIDEQHYCCTNVNGICPPGQKPYIHPLTDQVIKCNPQSFEGACPSEYVCLNILPGSTRGFCCSQAIVELLGQYCPENSSPLINRKTNKPLSCTLGNIFCGPNYFCHKMDDNKSTGICCSRRQRGKKKKKRVKSVGPLDGNQALSLSVESAELGSDKIGSGEPLVNGQTGFELFGSEKLTISTEVSTLPATTINTTRVDTDLGDIDGDNVIYEKVDANESESNKNGDLNSYESEHELYELEQQISALIKSTKIIVTTTALTVVSTVNIGDEEDLDLELPHWLKSDGRRTTTAQRGKTHSLQCPSGYRPLTYPGTNFLLHCSIDVSTQRNTRNAVSKELSKHDMDGYSEDITYGQFNDCPGTSICVSARGGSQNQMLCCVPQKSVSSKSSSSARRNERQRLRLSYLKILRHLRGLQTAKQREEFKSVESTTPDEDASSISELAVFSSRDAACPTVITDRVCIPHFMDSCVDEPEFFCHFNRELKRFACCSLRRHKRLRLTSVFR